MAINLKDATNEMQQVCHIPLKKFRTNGRGQCGFSGNVSVRSRVPKIYVLTDTTPIHIQQL